MKINQLDNNIDNNVDNDLDSMYTYISNNIDTLLNNNDIKSMLNPQTNKTTKKLICEYDERDAYILSFFLTSATLYSFLHHEISKKN